MNAIVLTQQIEDRNCFKKVILDNKWIVVALLVIFSSLCFFNNLHAEQTSGDTEFWFVAPDADNINSDNPTFIMIVAGQDTAVVNITLGGTPIATNIVIAPNSYYKHTFTWSGTDDNGPVENLRSTSGSVTNKGLHITSSTQVVAYYQLDTSGAKEIFTFKGKNALGTDFYMPFQQTYRAGTNWYTKAYAQIQIVATEDNTSVIVEPTAPLFNSMGNIITSSSSISERTRILNKGETLLWRANTNTFGVYPFLTGSRVFSDKPIAVTLFDDCLTSAAATDPFGDQLIPTTKLGKNYIVVKGFTSSTANATDHVGILAVKNNTQVYMNGVLQTTLNKGGYWSYDLGFGNVAPGSYYINTSEPTYCMHQSGGSDELGGALLPSLYSIVDRKTSFMKVAGTNFLQYIFLVFRDNATNGFTYNGNPLAVTPINAGFGDWKYAKVTLPSSANEEFVTVENSLGAFALGYFTHGNNPTVASVYGYLSSFGYYESSNDSIIVCGNEHLLTTPYAETYTWTLPDGTLSTESSLVATESGTYTLNMTQGSLNIVDSIFVKFQNFENRVNFPVPTCVNEPNNFSILLNPSNNSWNIYNTKYEWNFGNGASTITSTSSKSNTSTEVVSNIRWASPGIKTVTLRITNLDAGCDTVITANVLVNPEPTVSPILDQRVCLGANTTIVNYTGSLSADSSIWINDNPAIGLAASGKGKVPSFTTLQNGVANITVVAKSAAGCYGNSETFSIIVQDAFSDTIKTTICEGDYYAYQGINLVDPGNYTFKYSTNHGCDSIVTIALSKVELKELNENIEICSDSGYVFYGERLTTPGDYDKVFKSVNGCDSLIHSIHLSIKAVLDVNVSLTDYVVCGRNTGIDINYTVSNGTVSNYMLTFDSNSGLEPISGTSISSPISVVLDDAVIGQKMNAKLIFYDDCGNIELPLSFTIHYPDSVITQRWNDVLSVKNKNYNGGYEFTSFQWYKNGQPIAGATRSYYYTKDYTLEENLDVNAIYTVQLTQTGKSEAVMSCEYTPRLTTGDITLTPTAVRVGQKMVSIVTESGKAEIFHISGMKISETQLAAGSNNIQAPTIKGIYIVRVTTETGEGRTWRISVTD